MKNFDLEYKQAKRKIKILFLINISITIIIFILIIVSIIFLIKHPETIGEFAGKIANGFNSIKK